MLLDEVESDTNSSKLENTDLIVSISKVTASWEKAAEMGKTALKDVSADLGRNKLYIVVGSIGSGKVFS